MIYIILEQFFIRLYKFSKNIFPFLVESNTKTNKIILLPMKNDYPLTLP